MPSLDQTIASFKRLASIDVASSADAAHEALLVFARRQVTSSGAYGGKRWADFAGEPKYRAFKDAIGALAQPLRWIPGQERLVPALTDPRHPDHRWLRSQRGFELKITIPYVASIEAGGIGPFGERFPARPIFPSRSVQLLRGIREEIKRSVLDEIKATGLRVEAR